ncbi:MAG: hypothetical protein HYZ21_10000 [Chloroflexi bacterium]|nr:hypothetical protein [Chloroflexota bacterium]
MEYKIEIEEYADQKMVHTYIAGTMSEKERNRIGMETVHKMRENHLSKVIWDIREAELDYSLIHSHLVVLNLAALGIKGEDSIAVIYFHNKTQHEHAKTTAHNRNIFNLNYFENIEEGIAWLAGRR